MNTPEHAQYDGGVPDTPYAASPRGVILSGSSEWVKQTFTLNNATFRNRQNNGADFRLRVNCREFYVRRVTVLKTDRKS